MLLCLLLCKFNSLICLLFSKFGGKFGRNICWTNKLWTSQSRLTLIGVLQPLLHPQLEGLKSLQRPQAVSRLLLYTTEGQAEPSACPSWLTSIVLFRTSWASLQLIAKLGYTKDFGEQICPNLWNRLFPATTASCTEKPNLLSFLSGQRNMPLNTTWRPLRDLSPLSPSFWPALNGHVYINRVLGKPVLMHFDFYITTQK